jgi:Uma2 family endonuclease
MKPLIDTPPRTMMEVFKQLPEGTLAELIDNQIFMSPSPVFDHQDVLMEIAIKLRAELQKINGTVIVAPFDIFLDDVSNAVQPDIVVLLESNAGILNRNGHFHGIPDILVEVLSPGNRDHDLVKKKELYQRFGVKEYWIVDPHTKLTIGYEFQNAAYHLVSEGTGILNSKLLNTSISF